MWETPFIRRERCVETFHCLIENPSTLEGFFEMAAMCIEEAPVGFGLSLSEFCDMMPWHLDALLQFKVELRERVNEIRKGPDKLF